MEEKQYTGPVKAEVRSEQTVAPAPVRQDPDRFWKITTVVLIVILAFFAFRNPGTGTGQQVTGQVVNNVAAPAAAAEPPRVEVSIDDDPFLGKKDAPVTIVEFSDYQCPFCGRFYLQTLPQIKSKYIDTGKVKLVFRDFPLSFHPEAEPAAIAANCAGEQGKYFEFHDKIFGNQEGLSSTAYKQWAQELGLNVAKWEACLSDPQQKEEIRNDIREGSVAGVQGTPSFFINGRSLGGAQPFSVFEQVIEAELQ